MLKQILIVLFFAALGCSSPQKDGSTDKIDCTNIGKELSNCKGCSSRPECGWCGTPAADQSQCQFELATPDKPDTCQDDWHHNEVNCAPPPDPEKGAGEIE